MKKVVFASSSGGHLSEILKLEKLFLEYNYLLVTEKTDITTRLTNKYNMDFFKYGPSRNIFKYVYSVIYNIFKSIKIVTNFKPDTVISTGAQVGGIMCFIAKIFGKKVIYIESLAKVKTLSATGKLTYLFADKFYVQWENLAKLYDKAEYLGRLM